MTTAKPIIKIWGMRRSGTNWIHALLRLNTGIEVLQYQPQSKHEPPCIETIDDWEKKHNKKLYHLCIVRHPFEWLESMREWAIGSWNWSHDRVHGEETTREFCNRWNYGAITLASWGEYCRGKVCAVRYESVLESPYEFFMEICTRLEIDIPGKIDNPKYRVGPSHEEGHINSSPHGFSPRRIVLNERDMKILSEEIDWQGIADQLGYEFNRKRDDS